MKRRRKTTKVKFESHDQSPTDFSFSLTRVAVSQICQSVGYKSTDTTSTLNTLTLITTKFLQSIAELAASFSNAANRTEVNLFDIVNSLQDISLSTSDCFPGGSTLHDDESHCLIKSAALRNLSDFVSSALEIPFAKPLPKPEIVGSCGGDSSRVLQSPVEMKFIPAWLPPFPDSRLYLDRCTKDRSDHLWENSDSVIGRENFPESVESESSRGRIGGSLPMRRGRVRFKVERDWNSGRGGGSCTSDTRLVAQGGSGRDFDVKKKIGGEYIYSADIACRRVAYIASSIGDGKKQKN